MYDACCRTGRCRVKKNRKSAQGRDKHRKNTTKDTNPQVCAARRRPPLAQNKNTREQMTSTKRKRHPPNAVQGGPLQQHLCTIKTTKNVAPGLSISRLIVLVPRCFRARAQRILRHAHTLCVSGGANTHHAPSGRHTVGGGTGRGGDDEAVRLYGGEVLLVTVALQVCQVRARACRHARLIEN